MTDLGAINHVYRGALDADAGHGVSPSAAYAHLISIGANPNEALFLVSGAASESWLNPTAVHDGGKGYGLFGHNGSRLLAMHQYAADRGQDLSDWRTQFGFGLQELRSRPEGRAVANATSPEQMGMAQMYFERPQGFTPENPEAGHNYTGRVNQIRYFTTLNPGATGMFAPSANPQVTPEQVSVAAPAGLGAPSEADLRQKLADLEAQMRNRDSADRPPPLISQLLGMAVNPIRDAVSDGLTALLAGGSGGETGPSLDASTTPQRTAPAASLAPPGTTGSPAPAPVFPPAPAVPLPASRPANTSSLGSPFAAAGLPAPQQPASASIAPASPLPTLAQGSGLDRLATLFAGGVTKPSGEVL